MPSFFCIDFEKHPNVREALSKLVKQKMRTMLGEGIGDEAFNDLVKIILICLSTKFGGDEKLIRDEFVEIFDNNKNLVSEFLDWAKKEIPVALEKIGYDWQSQAAPSKSDSREASAKEKTIKRKSSIKEGKDRKEKKSILERIKPARNRDRNRDRDRDRDRDRKRKKQRKYGKRGYSDFESDESEERERGKGRRDRREQRDSRDKKGYRDRRNKDSRRDRKGKNDYEDRRRGRRQVQGKYGERKYQNNEEK